MDLLTILSIISWRRIWELRVISHHSTPKTMGHMVQTQLMASVNPKIENPLTIVKRQLQTFLTAIEQLTQQNEALM